MVIYVWPNGNWLYDFEVTQWVQTYGPIDGTQMINLDNLWAYVLTKEEQQAVVEALGGE